MNHKIRYEVKEITSQMMSKLLVAGYVVGIPMYYSREPEIVLYPKPSEKMLVKEEDGKIIVLV